MFCKRVLQAICFLCIVIAAGWLDPAISYPEEASDKTLELETGLYYTIQKGDTLWDLSERFFDSPWIWPDLWKKNDQIRNPHWIEPGDRIRLFVREDLETLVEPEPEPEPEVVVEPPEPPYYLYPAINSVGFIKEKPVSPSGVIFKVKEGKVMISEGDLVYIRPTGRIALGDRFTIFRTLNPLKGRKAKKLKGVQHLIVGLVDIIEVQPKFSMGRIVESFQPIRLNDLLMPYKERSPKITLAESKAGLEAKIIATERGETIFGDHAVVFIDKGRKDGVRIGQSYSVYYQEKERIDPKVRKDVPLLPVDFGKILILHTEEITATALVTNSEKTIQAGAKIHASSH